MLPQLLILGAGLLTAFSLNEEEKENTENRTSPETEQETDKEQLLHKRETVTLHNQKSDFRANNTEARPANTPSQPTQKPYPKRGERFTDPETGEQLQVRAIGGRPRKYSPQN